MEEPLLPVAAAAAAGGVADRAITKFLVMRISVVLLVAGVALFARNEASKGIGIIVRSSGSHGTAASRAFELMYVSNGAGSRLVYRASRDVERMLYPDESFPRKHVRRVTLRLGVGNFGLAAGDEPGEFVVALEEAVMAAPDVALAVESAVMRAVARIWTHDGPEEAVRAVVDYVSASRFGISSAPSNHTTHADGVCSWSAELFQQCEERTNDSCVAKANRAMAAPHTNSAALLRLLCKIYENSSAGSPAEITVDRPTAAVASTNGRRGARAVVF